MVWQGEALRFLERVLLLTLCCTPAIRLTVAITGCSAKQWAIRHATLTSLYNVLWGCPADTGTDALNPRCLAVPSTVQVATTQVAQARMAQHTAEAAAQMAEEAHAALVQQWAAHQGRMQVGRGSPLRATLLIPYNSAVYSLHVRIFSCISLAWVLLNHVWMFPLCDLKCNDILC